MGWDKQSAGGAAPAVNVNVVTSVPIDVTDRAGRLLGVVSGAVGITGTVDVSDRSGRLLGVISGSVDVIDRVGRLLGIISGNVGITGPVDVSGSTVLIGGQPINVDVIDRAARLLGITTGTTALVDAAGNAIESVLDNTHRALRVDIGDPETFAIVEKLERIAEALELGTGVS